MFKDVNKNLATLLYEREAKDMPIKKPSDMFGFENVMWLVIVFTFLIIVFTATGCKTTETVRDEHPIYGRGNRHDN
jgi:hypothetical protein